MSGIPRRGGAKGKKEAPQFEMPAYSINPPKKVAQYDWEKLKKTMVRRQAPEGEDTKEIKRIMKEIKDRKDITVQEFITLIGPYTSDNGVALRTVMAEDLESFRKMSRKVYETMTQDISDVLVNEQLQMMQYYQEKHDHLTDKMMRAVNEIYDMVPEFDFEKFLADKEGYLNKVLPLPAEVVRDEAEIQMHRRQQAYHRLQWLRSEGERMNEENKRLQRRLDELKLEQQMEQERCAERAAADEEKRQQLMVQEAQVKNTLVRLNESVEKTFVDNEAAVTRAHNKEARRPPPAIKKTQQKRKQKKPEWVSVTAADVEEEAAQQAVAEEVSKIPDEVSRTSFRRPRGRSPHFSPVKSPPPACADRGRERSPFHYSPPMETKLEEATTTVQQKRPPPTVRQSRAPKDTWGGFY